MSSSFNVVADSIRLTCDAPDPQPVILAAGPNARNGMYATSKYVTVSAGETGSEVDIMSYIGEVYMWSDVSSAALISGPTAGYANLVEATHDNKLGFFASAPVVKPTVTGNKTTDLKGVVTSLLSALSALGLITDSTT